jgi:hypothetical protein
MIVCVRREAENRQSNNTVSEAHPPKCEIDNRSLAAWNCGEMCTVCAYRKLAEGKKKKKGGWVVGAKLKVASATASAAMLVLHPKLLRSRLILIAARCIPGLVGRRAVVRVLRVRCATCGISFPFFNLGSSIKRSQMIRYHGSLDTFF